jgi:hypothetical protein
MELSSSRSTVLIYRLYRQDIPYRTYRSSGSEETNVFQCIPAKYLVPVIKALGHQLEVLNVRLHMQVNLLFLR